MRRHSVTDSHTKEGAMKALKFVALLLFAGLVACEGDQGPAGPKGDTGNANVKTGSIAPTNAEWLWNSTYSLESPPNTTTSWFTRYVDVARPEITADIIANGAVLVFMEPDPGTGEWVPLNYTYTSFGNNHFFHFVYEASEGLLRLHFFMTPKDGASPSTQTYTLPVYTFRYMIIAGTALQAARQNMVDLRDYESAKAFAEAVGAM
jgi:hypothetical protein